MGAQKVIAQAAVILLVDQDSGVGCSEEYNIYWLSQAWRERVVYLLKRPYQCARQYKKGREQKERARTHREPTSAMVAWVVEAQWWDITARNDIEQIWGAAVRTHGGGDEWP